MNEAAFRRMALGHEGAIEGAHMGHPDFRAAGRIFATLRGDGAHGMVKLKPEQQETFVTGYPAAFIPESGAWGRQGCTRVVLAGADPEVVGEAMTLAWREAVNRPAAKSRPKPAKRQTHRRTKRRARR